MNREDGIVIGAVAFIGVMLITLLGGVAFITSAQAPIVAEASPSAIPTRDVSSTPPPLPTLTPRPTNTATPTETQTVPPTLTLTPTLTSTPSPTPLISPTPTLPAPASVTPGPAVSPTPPVNATPVGTPREVVVPILMYHYISEPPPNSDIYRHDLSVPPDEFQAQMQWLSDNGYNTISLYDLIYALNIGKSLPPKPIILTFDDGYIDNYQYAFPILESFDYQGTFFILTDWTDDHRPGYMTWNMLREMRDAGQGIEVHGRHHSQYMSDQDEDWLFFHLYGPQEIFEEKLGYTPRFLAYISGRYDELTIEKAREFEYWGALTTKHGSTHTSNNLFELTRVRISGAWDLGSFAYVVDTMSSSD